MQLGIVLPAGQGEEPYERCVRGFRQRIGRDQRVRVRERAGRVAARTFDELAQHAAPNRAEAVALGHAPVVEAMAGGQIEAVEELALEQLSRFLQRGQLGLLNTRGKQLLDPPEIDEDAPREEHDPLAVGTQAHGRGVVDHDPQLAQAPAQRAARVVRSIPEEVAQALPQLRRAHGDQVAEQGPGALGGGKHHAVSRSRDPQVADQVDPDICAVRNQGRHGSRRFHAGSNAGFHAGRSAYTRGQNDLSPLTTAAPPDGGSQQIGPLRPGNAEESIMRPNIRYAIIVLASVGMVGTVSTAAPAQQTEASAQAAYRDIEATLGFVPGFFKAFPQDGIAGAWAEFKGVQLSPATALPPKVKELIGLGVASQIPCAYCVYFHTAMARANGATDEEVREAVAMAAISRHWSTVLNGMQVDLSTFKQETDKALRLASEKAKTTARTQ